MITMDDKDIWKYERDLRLFAEKAYPFATRNTINRGAFTAQKKAKEHVRSEMVLRNRFTERSIQVVPERRELNVKRQEATVGSTAGYMEDQEFGTIKAKGGKEGVPIATSYSAGQRGQQPRTRMPRRANALQNIQLSKRSSRKAKNKRQANLIKVKQAAESGQKYVFLDLRRGAGIFKVVGGKRRPRLRMLWDLSRKTVVVPPNPWLKPSVDATRPLMAGFYKDSLEFQVRRNGLFR